MTFRDELRLLLKARAAVIQVVTFDEEQVAQELLAIRATEGGGAGVYAWDSAEQFRELAPSSPPFDKAKQATANTVLNLIEGCPGPAVFMLPDFHLAWAESKAAVRKLRTLARSLPRRERPLALVIVTPTRDLPVELKHDVVQLEMPKPDLAAVKASLLATVGRERVEERLVGPVAQAALGLSAVQVERTFRKAFASAVERRGGRLDEACIDLIREEKQRVIRESGALSFAASDETAASVGGLEVLREWLEVRREAFSERAAAYGLEPPGGLALVGIPGTGKSLCAKVAASVWRMPLLRLDMGAVFGGVLGSSERNIREAIEISELVSPCILWVDEIEKAFAGSGGDSGTAARVLGTFLTWMQEKRKPVCALATANDVNRLPPEFLRKGRFDEVFFLDLPTREERSAILKVHLGKRGYRQAERRFELDKVLAATEGFVGAELEALVKDAMFPAFMDGERQLETGDLVKSAGAMVPLAKSRAEHIAALRGLVVRGEARNASRTSAAAEVKCDAIRAGRLLEV
jgi:MoxR-like ATPase